jgi:Ca2+-binding EF-hand superfamily protein
LEIELNDEEILKIINEIDVDNDSTLGFKEFLKLLEQIMKGK